MQRQEQEARSTRDHRGYSPTWVGVQTAPADVRLCWDLEEDQRIDVVVGKRHIGVVCKYSEI